MAIKDGNDATPGDSTVESTDPLDATFEILDEEDGLTMDTRGPRRDRWPTNDFY